MIGDVEYDKADLIVTRENGKEDLINLIFKRFSNRYNEGDIVELTGNVRSFSEKLESGKNKVSIYVFTYFDIPEEEEEIINEVHLDGRICKIEELRQTNSGKDNIHFILANNIITQDGSQKLNNYIPCVAWGRLAREISSFQVSDKLNIVGELHSRVYKKYIDENEMEFRTAHEIVIKDFERIE